MRLTCCVWYQPCKGLCGGVSAQTTACFVPYGHAVATRPRKWLLCLSEIAGILTYLHFRTPSHARGAVAVGFRAVVPSTIMHGRSQAACIPSMLK